MIEINDKKKSCKVSGTVDQIAWELSVLLVHLIGNQEDHADKLRGFLTKNALSSIYFGSRKPPKKEDIKKILDEMKNDVLDTMKIYVDMGNDMKDGERMDNYIINHSNDSKYGFGKIATQTKEGLEELYEAEDFCDEEEDEDEPDND